MARTRLGLLVFAAALWPAVADASWWAWLEELSGPGPFTGTTISVPIRCQRTGGAWTNCWDGTKPAIKRTVAVRIGWFDNDDRPRFKDLPAADPDNRERVRVVPVSGLWLFRLHKTIDIGPGAGVLLFSGEGFDTFPRLVLTPISATISPFALCDRCEKKWWSRVFRLELETSFVTAGFKGTDFGNTRTTFKAGPEFLTRVGLVLDFGR